ncbi:uncharacterized protein EAE98_012433 [Botrytis deweyae]|uniref:ABC transmembrane type-1 domain-containing protein n=1 Tax=Botrytis deweyae TaxID=2478750 RepID=A0ABQ7I374_9HELO|nr:uncharacterized protein EAE98_012433 [Botrytis deweyae]KAF7908960.1 hypothetical protein EAE98_012433 [Botrytis deweyae]
MTTTTILASLLHSIENFLAYLFTPLDTHLSSSAQQFLIISSACFTAIMIFSFLNKAVNTIGALLTRIPISPERLLNQAIGEFEAIPTSAETFLSQAFCKFDAVRNHKTERNHEDMRDCKTALRNKKTCWQPTAKLTKYMLMALYGIFLTCYFAYVVVEFEGWVREGIIVLSGLSLVNVGVLSLLGGARGGGLVMLGFSLVLSLLIGRGLVY